jgi:hypothetical protein
VSIPTRRNPNTDFNEIRHDKPKKRKRRAGVMTNEESLCYTEQVYKSGVSKINFLRPTAF